MNAKVVLTADFHLHPYRIGSRDGGHDRLLDGLSCLRQSLDLARSTRAPWVNLGDFKQPKTFWPQEALTGSHEVLREYDDVEKVFVVGNHDQRGLGGSGLAPFKDVARVVEEAGVVATASGELVCAPWNADLEVVRGLLAARPLPVYAHGFLAGSLLGPEDTRIAKGRSPAEYGDFSVAFFGDVHKGQWRRPGDPVAGRPPFWSAYPDVDVHPFVADAIQVRPPGAWAGEVFYCGSPYQQSWGERSDPAKGALVADLGSGDVWLHPFASPRFRYVELPDREAADVFVSAASEGRYANDFVRVVYSGPSKGRPDFDDDDFRTLEVIVRKDRVVEKRADIHAGLPVSEILARYVASRPPHGVESLRAIEAGLRLAGVAS